MWLEDYVEIEWSRNEPRLTSWKELSVDWDDTMPLRGDFERRLALIEIDVLTAQSLGITVDDLIATYLTNCPVLKQYEEDTFYDQKGRIVFTSNRGLTEVGVTRTEWDKIKDNEHGSVELKIIDDTSTEGPLERIITYYAPFSKCDRIADYRNAWEKFEKRFQEK